MIRHPRNWFLVPMAAAIGVLAAHGVSMRFRAPANVTPARSVTAPPGASHAVAARGASSPRKVSGWQPVAFNEEAVQTSLRIASLPDSPAPTLDRPPVVRAAPVAAKKAPPVISSAPVMSGPTVRAAAQPESVAAPAAQAPLPVSDVATPAADKPAQESKFSQLTVLDARPTETTKVADKSTRDDSTAKKTAVGSAAPSQTAALPPAVKVMVGPDRAAVKSQAPAVVAARAPQQEAVEPAAPPRELFAPPPLERPIGSVGASSPITPDRKRTVLADTNSSRRDRPLADPTVVARPPVDRSLAATTATQRASELPPPAVNYSDDDSHLIVKSIVGGDAAAGTPAAQAAPPPRTRVAAAPKRPVPPRLVPPVAGPVVAAARPPKPAPTTEADDSTPSMANAGESVVAAQPQPNEITPDAAPRATTIPAPAAPQRSEVAAKPAAPKSGWGRNLWPQTTPGALEGLPSVDQMRTAKSQPTAPRPAPAAVVGATPVPGPRVPHAQGSTAMAPARAPAAPALPATLPLTNMAPMRPPYLMVVAQRAQERINYGFNLAERGAIYSAETEFNEALLLVAQALDAAERTEAHGKAMSAGLRAFREAEDFVPRDAGVAPDIMKIAATHQTPVLKQSAGQALPVLVAMQEYYSYAQYQLTVAGGHEPTAAAALYGLARLQAAVGGNNESKKMMGGPRAIALHQAALAVDPTNFAAANELGVLLARYGQWPEAQAAFLHSVCISSQPESWRNLATAYDALGDKAAAQSAWGRYDLARQEKQRGPAGTKGGGGDRPTVQFVDTQTFVQKSGGPEAGDMTPRRDTAMPLAAASTPPAQQQAPQPPVAPQVTPPESQAYPLSWLKSKVSNTFSKTAHQDEQPATQRR